MSRKNHWAARHTTDEEQVFAVQYGTVKLEKNGVAWKGKGKGKGKVQLKGIHLVDFQDGVYGSTEDDREVIYEDDEMGESEEESESQDGWAPHLSEDILDTSFFANRGVNTFIIPTSMLGPIVVPRFTAPLVAELIAAPAGILASAPALYD